MFGFSKANDIRDQNTEITISKNKHFHFNISTMGQVARVKYGIRRHPGHRPDYYIIQPCAGKYELYVQVIKI
jgi:hypothetical protein